MGKKSFPINGPAGTMFESTVSQTRFYLPANLGGGFVDLTKLSLNEARELMQKGWEVLQKKDSSQAKAEMPEFPANQKSSKRKK